MEDPPSDRDDHGFWVALTVVAVVALAIRVAYVLAAHRDFEPRGDAFYYHAGANLLASGRGFISPFAPAQHLPAADHPPLYVMYLAAASRVGLRTVLEHQLWSCVAGTATVFVVGIVGRTVFGARVGIIAAFVAAVYPNMWTVDATLQAETLGMLLVVTAVLLTYRAWQQPSWQRLAAVGALCGLAALARSELMLLVLFLLVPLALFVRATRRQRLGLLATGCVATVVVVAPWCAYNAGRFHHTELLSTQFGPLLASSNCDSAWRGVLRGYFDNSCTVFHEAAAQLGPDADESDHDAVDRRAAFTYVRKHLSGLGDIELVRVGRVMGLYHPSRDVRLDKLFEVRSERISWFAVEALWWVEALAVVGVVAMRRGRHVPAFPLMAGPAVVLVTVLVSYGGSRFRTSAEPLLVVLAAVAVDLGVRTVWSSRGTAVRPAPRREPFLVDHQT